ncbi:MAG: nucleotide exchange factor GrpE, partial [Planctomycetota bacterium]
MSRKHRARQNKPSPPAPAAREAQSSLHEEAARGSPEAGPPPPAEEPRTELLVPESALREAEAKRDEYLELAQRARAELQNFRKRVLRERELERRRFQAGLVRELLGPLDDLERALV